ncbi:MAG: hypothetical protein H6835_01250 [Planctomycetes bacterium]|nr:hypothetical protein [Planctomycetota bacterium]
MRLRLLRPLLLALFAAGLAAAVAAQNDAKTVRVFVFAGQSNMVGSDSRVADVDAFPPFAGACEEQPKVRFWYVIGREDKHRSDGWVALQPVDGVVGPELTFARELAAHQKAPIAIVKIAAGGTTLGKDWNPDHPDGFALYPLALETVKAALQDLDAHKVKWRLEGFVWHQGENDMFDDGFRDAYANNLANFIASWRRDLQAPQLRFQLGELCEKTVWGMDNRDRMFAIKSAQQQVAAADPLVDYVPTSHVSVEIGGGTGLHYHYGTLGQLEHGVEHARSYLASIGVDTAPKRALRKWPYADGAAVDLWVLAGHRNMEGERAFTAQLKDVPHGKALLKDRDDVAFRYSVGGGVQQSAGWEPLGPAGRFDTFGPELSFGAALARPRGAAVAIAKFTHSGSQIVDWTPNGSKATSRNLYQPFVAFVKEAVADLEQRGHEVHLRGIVYHLGENDMSWTPHRQNAAKWLGELIAASRQDLGMPELRWFVAQQRPIDHQDVNRVDVVADVKALCDKDPCTFHVECFDAPPQRKQLVIDTAGVVWLGEQYAEAVQRAAK